MCLRYLARGRERWRSTRDPRRLRTTRRPGALARAHAPGTVPRASLPPHRARHGPLVRRRSAAAIGPTTRRRGAVDAPQKAAPPARASRMSVGVAAHVFSGNCGVVRRSKPLNPRADCVLGHGVAMALRYHFFSSFRLRPLGATALRLLEQVQGILDAVRAVYGGTGGRALPQLFCAIFYCRNSEASGRLGRDPLRHVPGSLTSKLKQNDESQASRRRNDARAVGDATSTPPLRPGLPPARTPVKQQHKLRTSAPRPRANRRNQKRQNA